MAEQTDVIIDGKTYTGYLGESLLELALRHKIDIPLLCYEPRKPCLGTCRVCTIKWKRHFVAACSLTITEGMDLSIDTPELHDVRKGIIELLFVEGNHFCPSCEKSGNCFLQAQAYHHGMTAPRFHYRFSQKSLDFRCKKIVFDQNRCIYCKRCVLHFKDKDHRQVIAFKYRGRHLELKLNVERIDRLDDKEVDELVDLCPVGALLKKGRGFRDPIGNRRFDENEVSLEDYLGES